MIYSRSDYKELVKQHHATEQRQKGKKKKKRPIGRNAQVTED